MASSSPLVKTIFIFGVVLVLNAYLLPASGKEISSKDIKRISAAEWERAINDHPELREVIDVADNGEIHPYVHSRNRRTIGRVFDMFRGLFDRIFGGKKGGGGGGGGYGAPQKKPAASYGPPTKPPSGYGPPKSPKKPSYGRQKQRKPKPGYGAPGPKPRPPGPRPPAPRPQRPRPQPQYGQQPPSPPRPRPQRPQAPVQQGYGGPRPARPAPGGYGGPQIPNQPNYGGPQPSQQPNDLDGYGSPQAPVIGGGGDIDGYGSPQAPVVGGGDIDGYGSPQAPVVGGGDIDGYGSPQAPVVGGGDIDGYGSPQAPVVGGGDIDGYGAPQAPVVGGGGIRNSGQYGAPIGPVGPVRQPNYGSAPQSNYGSAQQQFRGAPQPSIGPSIQLSVGAPFPAAPVRNNALPTSASLADSVFRMIPAPNLATGRPPTAGNAQASQDSYGSPQGPVIGNAGSSGRVNAQPNQDSYGSPQGQVIGNGDSRQAGDSYGSPQAPRVTSSSAGNSYGSPVAPASSSNPFLKTSAPPLSIYTSQATFPAQSSGSIIVGTGKAQAPSNGGNIITVGNGDILPSSSSNPDSYGSPVGPGPITDIDLPSVIPGAIQPGIEQRTEAVAAPKDVYGSPVAPVGTSAPVPQDVLRQIENNLPEIDNNVFPSGNDIVPEGELVSTVIEDDGHNDANSVEYDEIEEEVIDELVDKIQQELDDPNLIKDPEDEKFLNEVITNLKNNKEVINTIEYLDPSTGSGVRSDGNQDSYGVSSETDDRGNSFDDQPLFDNVRDIVSDPPATGTPGTPTIDLASGGFVDFSNGVLAGDSDGKSTASEINLTGTTTSSTIIEEITTEAPETRDYQDTYGSATTVQPVYEDIDDYDTDGGSRSEGQEYEDEEKDDEEDSFEEEEEDDDDEDDEDDDYEESDEGVQGYDIRPPENPLDSSLSGIFHIFSYNLQPSRNTSISIQCP